ncbi:exonuclease V, chloroplastic-like [Abrus precatorius]|uniref:Exonuclease V, chloroplastic-like n=1 Tax=Abrus precatorius TaxID=3816 RepID=A0A8B8MEK9_ABRPR|nr:exonuclease V, chloroplastic-like [Abrus precatorius]
MAGTSSKTPIEIVSDNFASAACSPLTSAAIPTTPTPSSASKYPKNAISIHSFSVQAKRSTRKKRSRVADTLLHRFRSKKGLFVTDVTKTEWCEKQMEFSLFHEEWKNNAGQEWCSQKQMDLALVFRGGREKNEAMRAGMVRHVQLVKEIQATVKVKVKSREDVMALKLVNFINGVNQLLFEGLTRELPIVSFAFAQGIWMVGKIDEVCMPKSKKDHNPILVETKTRFQDTVPSEPQKRNGKIQLMCYKYLWDNLVAHAHHGFPSKQFFDYFELSPQRALSEDLLAACFDSGISALTLDELVICYQNTWKMLPRAHNKLVLRYESQRDQSVLDEEKFAYNDGWIRRQIKSCLEFWLEQREATYVAEEEEWKCRYCDFASECPACYTDSEAQKLSSDYSSE